MSYEERNDKVTAVLTATVQENGEKLWCHRNVITDIRSKTIGVKEPLT